MMRSIKAALLSTLFMNGLFTLYSQSAHEGLLCTHGKLFISDRNTSKLYAFDLDGEPMDLQNATTLEVPGKPGQFLTVTGSGENLASVYRGTSTLFFADGRVNFINAGVSLDDHGDHFDVINGPPSIVGNAGFDCARPLHVASHDNKVAIFCDGSFDGQLNTTVWVVHEALMGRGSSAIVFSTTLQGSHHGVAVPVDDGHVLYSLALPERIRREPGTSSLPSTFQVVNYTNNVMHSLGDTNDPDTSCMGFHGEAASNDTIVLACNQTHGGLVVVDYDNIANTYSSRALLYPLSNHRTGTLVHSPTSHVVVGNLAASPQFHLLAFDPHDATTLDTSHVQTLEVSQCSFDFEQAVGKLLLVWLPTGKLQVYTLEPWTKVSELQVIPGMAACSEAMMVVGYGKAFIMTVATKKLFALDLEQVLDGGAIEVSESDLGFTPNSAVVAGVPSGFACGRNETIDDGEEEDPDDSCTAFFIICILSWLIEMITFGMITIN